MKAASVFKVKHTVSNVHFIKIGQGSVFSGIGIEESTDTVNVTD